jgi:cell division septum initiation protein DivIVA
MLIKDTEANTKQQAWFAVEDINRRAAAAYSQNRALFDSAEHQQRVETVVKVLRNYFAGWAAIYETARAATRNRDAHTEVKFNRVVIDRKKRRTDLEAALRIAGVDPSQIVFKPATESLSVHVR